MGDIIDINALRPHLTGTAVCLNCAHTYVAIAPIGTLHFECPECHLSKSVFCSPVSDDEVYHCSCGCVTFTLGRLGPRCCLCGEIVNPDY